MRSKFNELTGLYEQVNEPAADTNQPDQAEEATTATVDNTNTGKLHAFIIDESNSNAIGQIIQGKSKEWKSETPLKVLGKDGTVGATAMLNNKPLYLMIRVANKAERASSEKQLELNDRIYLLLNTSPEELGSVVKNADGIDERINMSVKAPDGKENTISVWRSESTPEINKPETAEEHDTNAKLSTDYSSVDVDMQAQIDNPGTAAGISGTVEEGVNEQVENAVKKVVSGLSADQKAVKTKLGSRAKVVKMTNGSPVVKLKLTKGVTGIDGVALFYANGRVFIKSNENKIIAKGSYSKGGTVIKINGGDTANNGNVYQNLKTVAKATNTSKPSVPDAFTTQEEGDKFRKWANSTPALSAKYGKNSKFDLDATGKFNNSFINKAYIAAKDDYTKASKEPAFDVKYNEGDIVYYRVKVKTAVEHGLANEPDENIEKKKNVQKDEMAKDTPRKTTPIEDQYAKGANPRVSEAIATSFDMYKQITEDDNVAGELASEDVDYQAGLIKDFKAGNIKKGKIIKQIDDNTVKLINVKSNKEATISTSDLIKKEDAKKAALKIKADKEAEEAKKAKENEKTDLEKSEEKLDKEKEETETAKKELKDKRKEKRNIKKAKRQDKKQAKKKNKIDKIDKKIDKVNANESVVYNFDDFIKSVNKLN